MRSEARSFQARNIASAKALRQRRAWGVSRTGRGQDG